MKTVKHTPWKLSVRELFQTSHLRSTESVRGLSLWKRSYVENFKAHTCQDFFFPFTVYVVIRALWLVLVTVPFCRMSSIKTTSFRSLLSCFWRVRSYIFQCQWTSNWWAPIGELFNNYYQLFHSAHNVIFWCLCFPVYKNRRSMLQDVSEFSWPIFIRLF